MDENDEKYFQLFGLTFPFNKSKIFKYTILVYLGLAVLLTVAVYAFGYEMTNADLPGGLVAGFLLAYLITIL